MKDIHAERLQTDGDAELLAKVLRGIADVAAGCTTPANLGRTRVIGSQEKPTNPTPSNPLKNGYSCPPRLER